MLNEDKIRLMTGIAKLEKDKGKDLAMVHRYFRGDYISHHMLRALLGYTLCWCLGFALVMVCRIEEMLYSLDLTYLKEFFTRYAVWYVAGLLVYLAITFVVQYRRYKRASGSLKLYLNKMKSLERRYAFQGRIKEPGKEVRRS